MKPTISFLIFLVFIFSNKNSFGAETIELTYNQALLLAVRDNRDVALKVEDLKKAKEKINEAKAGLWPTLTFTGGYSYSLAYYNKDMGSTSTQATVKQNLFKSGKIINTIKYNTYGVEIAQAELDATKLSIIQSTTKVFYTYMLAREYNALNQKIVDNAVFHLESIKARYTKGQASEQNVLSAQSSLALVQQALETSSGQVQAAGVALNTLLFLDSFVLIKPVGDFVVDQKEVAFDAAFLQAISRRPEIKQMEAQEKASKTAVSIAKSDARPSIYAAWDYYTRSHSTGINGLARNWNDYNTISLNFSWPIFDGWATQSKVEQSLVDVRRVQLLKEKAIQNIALELKNSYIALKNALAQMAYAKTDEVYYSDNEKVVEKQYADGLVSELDLDDARIRRQVALFNRIQSIYDYIVAKADFERAIGGL